LDFVDFFQSWVLRRRFWHVSVTLPETPIDGFAPVLPNLSIFPDSSSLVPSTIHSTRECPTLQFFR
jgi:hypothetical protein